MRQFALRVAEIAAVGGLIRVSCLGPEPGGSAGQMFLAQAQKPEQPFLRLPLLLHAPEAGQTAFYVPVTHPYARLQPDDVLDVLGPCGRGFRLPPAPANVLVIASSLERLLPAILHSVAQRLAVSVLTPRSAVTLPADVEIQRGPLSADMAGWADVVVLDVADPRARAGHIRALAPPRPTGYVQALVVPPMPCGTGACQACWVEARPGHRRLACVDGPVFAM